MRTTIDIPDNIMQEAAKLTQFKNKTDIVIYALQNLIKTHLREKLKNMAGLVEIHVDLAKTRKRHKNESHSD